MFEKEAEEWAKENMDCVKTENCLNQDCNYFSDEERIIAKSAFEDGAEFGYNKANEWHYQSKGEYPKECENVLCYCKVVNVEFYSIGHTIIGGDNKIRWWSSNRSEELNVYAWKEIVPPKENK